MIEYANNIRNDEHLEDLIINPIRGNIEKAENLYNFYKNKIH